MMWRQKIFSQVATKPLFRVHISGVEKAQGIKRPFLVVANHKSIFDSFALGNCVPFSLNILPAMAIGEGKSFNSPVIQFLCDIGFIKLLYRAMGVLSVTRGISLDESLKEPLGLLQKGGVVFVHPEGRVIKEEKIGEFKRGASYMAIKTGVKVLPIAFKIKKLPGKINLRKAYYVKLGSPFALPQEISVEDGAEIMRKIVADLYATI